MSLRLGFFVAIGGTALVAVVVGCNSDSSFDSFGFVGSSSGVSPPSTSSSSTSGSPSSSGSVLSAACDGAHAGGACFDDDYSFECELGTSSSSSCNEILNCPDQSQWSQSKATRATTECAYECPAKYTETVPSSTCSGPDAVATLCEFPEGICGCAPVGGPDFSDDHFGDDDDDVGDGGTPDAGTDAGASTADAGPRTYEWKCIPRQPLDGGSVACPAIRPHAGRACVVPITCDYGSCVFQDGEKMECYSGHWDRVLGRSKASCAK